MSTPPSEEPLSADPLPPVRPLSLIRILRTGVIDPLPASAAALADQVRARGHEAEILGFAEAAALAEKGALPDCLVLRLNHTTAAAAAELLAALGGRARDCFVVAVTDQEEPANRAEAWMKRGVHDFISSGGALGTRLAVAEQLLRARREYDAAAEETARAGRRYEELFQKSPEASLLVTSREGLILEANAAAGALLGLTRQELVQRFLALVLPELFDRGDYDPATLQPEGVLRLTEVRHQRPDHTRRWLDLLVTRVSWGKGHGGEALLLTFHDITALKEREARRLHEARLETAGRAMGGMARELGDHLTALRGNLELLRSQPVSRAEMTDLLEQAQLSCDRTVALSKRLAALARAPRGGDLRKRPVDFRTLVEKTVSFALLAGKARPVLRLSADLWPVEGDEGVLAETVRRIVTNANEAMPDGGALTVEAVNTRDTRAGEPSGVRVRFRDEGRGVHAEDLPAVFDPWFTTRPGREGMGLTAAAAAVKAHGGHIRMESAPGQGACVTLWLPVNPALIASGFARPLPPPSDGAGLAPVVTAAPERSPRGRLLFMDDDAGIRTVVRRIMTSSGFDVHCASDGQEAIDAWRKAHEFGSPFDLLLVDLDVRGGMGGRECAARLKAEFPNLKALLTTGYIDDELMETYRDHGFLGVIPKPFQLDRLVQSLARLLGRA